MSNSDKVISGSPNSTCARCRKPFHCGGSLQNCWCMEIQLSEEARASLRQRYQGCLCRECLRQFAEPNQSWKTQT